jgi:hypothetical protein
MISLIKNKIISAIHKRGYEIKKILPRPSILFIKNKEGGKPLIGAEIGIFEGDNAKSILRILPIKKIYLIDPYEKYEDYKGDMACNFLDSAEQKAKNKLVKHKEKIIWIKKRSVEALKEIPNDLDFVYIDGNHLYKFVKEDMDNYYKKLKVGGVLAGHDIGNGVELNEGVILAFVEFVNKNHLKPYILYPDWWVVKEKK